MAAVDAGKGGKRGNNAIDQDNTKTALEQWNEWAEKCAKDAQRDIDAQRAMERGDLGLNSNIKSLDGLMFSVIWGSYQITEVGLLQQTVDMLLEISLPDKIDTIPPSTSCWVTSALCMNIHAYEVIHGFSPTLSEVRGALTNAFINGNITISEGHLGLGSDKLGNLYFGDILNDFRGSLGIPGNWVSQARSENLEPFGDIKNAYRCGIFSTGGNISL